jgi:hypothetical protein
MRRPLLVLGRWQETLRGAEGVVLFGLPNTRLCETTA